MKTLISMFTMKRTNIAFRDEVTDKLVFYYKDRYGTEWLTTYPYYPFNFRIKSSRNETYY